jgi:hypothetical protein
MRDDCKLCTRRKTTCIGHMLEDVLEAWRGGMATHLRLREMLRAEGRLVA